MIKVYLFDWGDTLMVDFPNVTGKMCDWQTVQAVSGAKETLATLSKSCSVYIATGAADSSVLEIKLAFERVGLSDFISGYFCKANLGLTKGSPDFLKKIISTLNVPAANIAMVGDNIEKDIKPALAVGINPIWFNPNQRERLSDKIREIHKLTDLYR
ncbi:MAG: HAD family hydrolase [Litorilituus sp.]|jgi:putative hydrolase of the HAD superfamily|nr:HAD family hydrolase [Litorilituus sp.]